MENIERNGKNKGSGKSAALTFAPLILLVLSSAAVLLGPNSLYAAKPLTKLNSTLCTALLGGTWTNDINTCTIEGPSTAPSSFAIPAGTSLVIASTAVPGADGCIFTVGSGITITNSGTINVSNGEGNGVCNTGTISNSSTIRISNSGDNTNGIVNGGLDSLDSNGAIIPGTITNSGTIDISNSSYGSWGILSISTITNSGTINVSNAGDQSIGLFSLGGKLPDQNSPSDVYASGTLTNSGTIIISNNGVDSSGFQSFGPVTNSGTITASNLCTGAYGIQNYGTLTNNVAGTLNNNATGTTRGFYNLDGTMINYGVANNGSGATMETNGWVMVTYGTINNHGILRQTGGTLVNYGVVHNYGIINPMGSSDYPHNRGTCINETDENGVTGMGCQ